MHYSSVTEPRSVVNKAVGRRPAMRMLPVASALMAVSLLLAVLSFTGCKKVDEHADLVDNQPWLVTYAGLGGLYNIWGYNYPTNVLVGDTATFVGKLFIDRSGSSIEIGTVSAPIIKKARASLQILDPKTGKMDSLDVVRLIITKEMGIGNNIPVVVHANGYSIQGAPITIKLLNTGSRRTDTTLVVDKLGSWLPGNPGDFQNVSAAFVNNSSVANDGTLYFDNRNGIFKVAGEQVQSVIATGSSLTDQQQNNFAIDAVISSLISPDGQTLYFSAIVKENIAPAADSLYITRFCRMNMGNQQITTINRSTTLIGNGTYLPPLSPFSGAAGSINIAAANLKMDVNGNIWFANLYYPESNLMNPLSYSNYNSTTDWYSPLQACNNAIQPTGCLFNVCKLDMNNQVTSVMQTAPLLPYIGSPYYITQGPLLSNLTPYFMQSPDGSLIYGLQLVTSSFVYNFNQYSVKDGDVEMTITGGSPKVSFVSWDTAVATRLPTTGNFPTPTLAGDYNFNACQLLPNNDILYAAGNSLFAYDFDNMTAYCYAGTENQNTSVQTQETGPAKYVNYDGNNVRFCGVDAQGAVYYCTGGIQGVYASNDYVNGVRFYKLHPRN